MSSSAPPSSSRSGRGVDHYENFPVASWLCPPALRPAIAAIYWFARTADDLADEGDAGVDERLQALAAYRADLLASHAGQPVSARWRGVFQALRQAQLAHALPLQPLDDLLDAFIQDVRKTRDGAGYADRAELLDYCRRSANPVGRLLLHLYRIDDAQSLAWSDAICSALQLINFWQDLGTDLPRGRFYLPEDDCRTHGVDRAMLLAGRDTPATTALIAHEVAWARQLMLQGAPLARRVPGRAGWELRLVVQGGLRIAEQIDTRIRQHGTATLAWRPTLGRRDAPRLLWRALWM